MQRDTLYANTDFDLKSTMPFDTLNRELGETCRVLHYTHCEDGHWHSIVESFHEVDSSHRTAALDILAIIDAINRLSPVAKAELDSCYMREFNIGFECWDTWSYIHSVPLAAVDGLAKAGCSLAVTLYPMRNPDGTSKES
ncbi:hypothetical protein NA78x_003559 [Anatilimnocola sp. NA78]|uniref:hypothetical protein n=1 Tax=Anatilimnocola sp. NA78 TaxID=3415683 RepID=UPI003CE5692C